METFPIVHCTKHTCVIDLLVIIMDFLAGWLGGMVGVLIGHPLDTIRVHLQVRNPDNPHYQSIFTTLRHLLEKDGVRTLYRGISSPLVGLGFMNAVMFGIYRNVQKMFEEPESLVAETVAGGTSALGTAVITSPVELAKSRLQVGGPLAGKNPLDCLLLLYRQEGIYRGVFKGLGITMIREVPSNITYFLVFEHFSHGGVEEKPSLLRLFVSGGLAGVGSWAVPYPADVIKSKIQVDGSRGEERKYKNWQDCFKKTLKNEGVAGFYRGILPTLIRAFPVNGVTFCCVTLILRYLHGDEKHTEKHPHAPRVKETRVEEANDDIIETIKETKDKDVKETNNERIKNTHIKEINEESVTEASVKETGDEDIRATRDKDIKMEYELIEKSEPVKLNVIKI